MRHRFAIRVEIERCVSTCALSALLLTPFAVAADLPGDYSRPEGEWSGQAQYHATIGNGDDPNAHAVTRLSLSVEEGGRVTGASTGNGCHMLGVIQPFIGKMYKLDVTLSRCQYRGFNRRYTGTLQLNPAERYAAMNLRTTVTPLLFERPPVVRSYDIQVTLTR